MMMDDDHNVLAAEYVLGTLDPRERQRAESLIRSNSDFAALVRGWEQRFGPLHAMVPPIEPPPELFERIKQRLAGAGPTGGQVVALDTLRNRVGRWRSFGAAMTALAAVLLALLVTSVVRPDLMPAPLRPKPQVIEVVRTIEKPAELGQPPGCGPAEGRGFTGLHPHRRYRHAHHDGAPGRGRGAGRKELRIVACIKAISQTAIARARRGAGIHRRQTRGVSTGYDQRCDFCNFARAGGRFADRGADRTGAVGRQADRGFASGAGEAVVLRFRQDNVSG